MTQKIDLKQHNLETYSVIKDKFKYTNHIGTVQATGTGKSFLIAKSIQDMNFKNVLFLTSSLHIIDEFKKNFSFLTNNITFMTYKKLTYVSDLNFFLNKEQFDFVILDEYHRCGAKTWGKSVKELLELCKTTKVLGTTATPIRYLDNCRDMTKELFNSSPIVEISLLKAFELDIIQKPKYILSYYNINDDIETLKKKAKISQNEDITEKIQFIVNNLDRLVNIEDVLSRNIKEERKFIVFCSNVQHAKEMTPIVSSWFNSMGFDTKNYSIYTDLENKANTTKMRKELEEFKTSKPNNNEVHLLFSVNILNEGVHIDGIDGLIFLRKTTSPTIMYQQLGRALKSGDTKSPLIFDFVNNINKLSFIGDAPEFTQKERKSEYKEFDYSINGTIEVIDYRIELDNLLKDIETLSTYSNWNCFLESVKEFIEVNGTGIIPVSNPLYKRCLSIRKSYANNTLSKEKIDDLNKVGFKWDINIYNDELWEEMFTRLLEYKDKFNHVNVPISYVDKQLATWVKTQRKFKDTMSENRKQRLLDIGFEFEIGKKRNEEEWNKMFDKLLEFKKEFGYVNVSSRYEDKKLANWVNSQRKAYKIDKLSYERYTKLVNIGFKFPEKSK